MKAKLIQFLRSLLYRKNWPQVYSYWQPMGDEIVPPRLGVYFKGRSAYYKLEKLYD